MKKKKHNEEKKDFREFFLEKFVESLILHAKPSEFQKKEETRLTQGLIKEIEQPEIPSEFKVPEGITLPATTQMLAPLIPTAHPQPISMAPLHSLTQQPLSQKRLPQPYSQQLPPYIQQANPTERVTFLLRDPAVASVECPGPEKNIIVRKFGAIQTTPITLTQDEINKIINEFSEKTRIPLIEGVFKASVGNLIITAVISEFVGARFIIEKITPAPMRRY